MASSGKHKNLMYATYQRPPSRPLPYIRAARTEKFAPIFNQKLKKGIVVDLGCGIGTYTKLISSRKVVGIDFSLECLKVAKKSCLARCVFVLGDMEHLPFKRESIDSFFSFCSIYCLLPKSQHKLLEELYSVLKENGNILLVEPSALNPYTEKKPKYPLHREKVRQQLERVGFKNIDIKYCNFISRYILIRGGILFDFFQALERFFEFLQAPWAGALMIYAEKKQN